MPAGISLSGLAAGYSGLDWVGVGIDRSQSAGTAVNTKLMARGGAVCAATWSALQGAGSEAAGIINGVNVNQHVGVAWRVLQYSIPFRVNSSALNTPGSTGDAGALSDVLILDCQIMSSAALQTDTGVFLMQWAGVAANVVLPSGGAPIGFGFRPNGVFGNQIQAWTSLGGAGASSAPASNASALRRCILKITSSQHGIPGTYAMTVDGFPLQAGTLNAALGADYTIAGATLVPIVSAGAGATLYVADLTVLNTTQGYL
jgi:hypothetical protein